MIAVTPAAQATRSLDDVLARLDALEKENTSLRKRVQRLESAERERLVVAAIPASPARTVAPAAMRAAPAAVAISPAAGQAFAAVPAIEQARNWTGLYLGASAGLRREDHKWSTNTFLGPPAGPVVGFSENFNDTGARIGGFAGYNVMLTPKIVASIEGDFAWGRTETSTKNVIPGTFGAALVLFGPFVPNDSSEFKTGWDATLRGRIGALITPDTLAYVTGGAAWQRITATATCDANVLTPGVCVIGSRSDTQHKTLTGWTLGAGVEAVLAGAWSGRIEYRYAQYKDFSHLFIPTDCCDGNLNTTISLATHTFIAGLAYKFGGY
jgi:outer membrane immunogenic protein